MDEEVEQHISLDEVATGRIPERILAQIENMTMTVEEMLEWEKSKPAYRVVLTDGQLDFNVRQRVRWKSKRIKVITSVTVIIGGLWSFIQFIYPIIS